MHRHNIVVRRQTGKPESQALIEKRVAFFLGGVSRELQCVCAIRTIVSMPVEVTL